MAENLLSVKHAAVRLDVSPKTVYRLIYAGLLEPRNVGLGTKKPRIRVADSELERYIATTVEATHPPSGPSTPPPPPGPKPAKSSYRPRPGEPPNPPKPNPHPVPAPDYLSPSGGAR